MDIIKRPKRPEYDYKITHYTISSGNVAYQLAKADRRRKKIVFSNGGDNNARLSPKNDVTTIQGIPLIKGSGYVEIDVEHDENLPLVDWFCMAEGETNVYILEVFEV